MGLFISALLQPPLLCLCRAFTSNSFNLLSRSQLDFSSGNGAETGGGEATGQLGNSPLSDSVVTTSRTFLLGLL
ncbi:hypothetical protein EXN66_Car016415 [Channa argus]|uniref:Secreted protein n=1 Tax=Channa argus TaxID=215402 RepID=A0A6G1QE20_CHAAH|nr:hypothetical protein EXN66_Car016415 [Channa argus]